MNEFTIGRGIAIAGKWICIAIMFVALLNLVDNIFFDNDRYYAEPPPIRQVEVCSYPNTDDTCIIENKTIDDNNG